MKIIKHMNIPISKLTAGTTNSLIIEHLGARKILTLDNHLILTKITRGDGKIASTHPCTPIFGPDRNNRFGLIQHGQTRNQLCAVRLIDPQTLEITHPIDDPGYPSGITITQKLSLSSQKVNITTSHTNHGRAPAPIIYGEHCYFDAPQSFQGTTINGQDITQIVLSYPNGFPIPLTNDNHINIPGKPTIRLTQQALAYAMVWVGYHPETGNQDSDYICIEPVEANPLSDFFGSEASLLQPGQTRTCSFSLTLTE